MQSTKENLYYNPLNNTYSSDNYLVYHDSNQGKWVLKEKAGNVVIGEDQFRNDLVERNNLVLSYDNPKVSEVEHITNDRLLQLGEKYALTYVNELENWDRASLLALNTFLSLPAEPEYDFAWNVRNWCGTKINEFTHKRSFALTINTTDTVRRWIKAALFTVMARNALRAGSKGLADETKQHMAALFNTHLNRINDELKSSMREIAKAISAETFVANSFDSVHMHVTSIIQDIAEEAALVLVELGYIEEEVQWVVIALLNEYLNKFVYDDEADEALFKKRVANLRDHERQAVINFAYYIREQVDIQEGKPFLQSIAAHQYLFTPEFTILAHKATEHPSIMAMFLGLFHDFTCTGAEHNDFIWELIDSLTEEEWCPPTIPSFIRDILIDLTPGQFSDLAKACKYLNESKELTWGDIARFSKERAQELAEEVLSDQNNDALKRLQFCFTRIAETARRLATSSTNVVELTDGAIDACNTAAIRILLKAMTQGITFYNVSPAASPTPLSGYHYIEGNEPVYPTTQQKQEAVADRIRRLGPVNHFQFFKLVSEARKLKTQDFNALHQINASLSETLFPGQDVARMKASLTEISNAYYSVEGIEQPTPGDIVEFFQAMWKHVGSFYPESLNFNSAENEALFEGSDVQQLIEARSFKHQQEPMDTSFTNTILDTSSVPEFVPGMKLEAPRGAIGRAGMTVRGPKDFLDQMPVMQANADQETINNISAFLDDNDYMKKNGKWDLARKIFSIEFHVDIAPGTSLNNVFLALQNSGWEANTTADAGIFRLEAKVNV